MPSLHSRSSSATLVLALFLCGVAAHAQTFTVIHTFSGGGDGGTPSGLTLDAAGNVYGAATNGGINEPFGAAFRLKNSGAGWVLNPLYEFSNEGGAPAFPGVLTLASDGSFYGPSGGGADGYGTVYRLQPPLSPCKTVLCYWNVTVLYNFTAGPDGHGPNDHLIFDSTGNIYGTTETGGAYGYGTVFKLTHSSGGWSETTLYSFMAGDDGNFPVDGVVMDAAGNLYGTTRFGGINNCSDGCGTVFEVSPSGSGWTEQVIYRFQGNEDAYLPYGGVILDPAGNLYGATYEGGQGESGVVYELSPSGAGWNYTALYNLTGNAGGAWGRIARDSAGNLYGTTIFPGTLFKLSFSGGHWVYTDLHDFSNDDGTYAKSSVVIDAHGNIYGTSTAGGRDEQGTAWEYVP